MLRHAVLLLVLASTAAAHDCWIEPVETHPIVGRVLGVRLFVGEPGQAEAFPRRAEKVVRFVARGPKGEVEVGGANGDEPAGRFVIGRGVHVVGYRNTPSVIELEAAKFEEYLREEGLDDASKLRAERGETGEVGRERYSRCAKAIVAAGEPGGPGWETSLGLDLELVPEKNPLLLAPGEELPVRVLLRGQPLAGAKVAAWSRARFDLRTSGRTDAEGRARLTLPVGGRWVVTCVRMEATTDGGPQDWESLWSSLSFAMQSGAPRFQADIAVVHSAPLTGCALGDLDGAAGDEVVAVGEDGVVVVARHEPRAWRSEVAAVASGALLAVATGELVADAAGQEVVAVGASPDGRGQALLLRRHGATWRATGLLEDERPLRAVAVVGAQLFVAGDGRRLHRLEVTPEGGWRVDLLGELPGPARSAAATPPRSSMPRVSFACADGSVVLLLPPSRDAPGWTLQVVDTRSRARASVNTGIAATLVGDDDGLLTVVSERYPRWTVLEAGVGLRGAVSGQLAAPGPMHQVTIAAVNGEVTHAWLEGGETTWRREVVAKDSAELRGLVFGRVAGPHEPWKPCVVVASASGKLLVVRRPE